MNDVDDVKSNNKSEQDNEDLLQWKVESMDQQQIHTRQQRKVQEVLKNRQNKFEKVAVARTDSPRKDNNTNWNTYKSADSTKGYLPSSNSGTINGKSGFQNSDSIQKQQQKQQELLQRKMQVKELKEKLRKQKIASASMDLPKQPLVTTIGGGTSMIFEMARRLSFWEKGASADFAVLQPNNPVRPGEATIGTKPLNSGTTASSTFAAAAPSVDRITMDSEKGISSTLPFSQPDPLLPRWHPTSGIVSDNPSFRTKPPIMNNEGYAGIIWRNVRKRNKPAMWRYALRSFDRMLDQRKQNKSLVTAVRVQPTNVHYEGALLACAKLGYAKRALEIYNMVESECSVSPGNKFYLSRANGGSSTTSPSSSTLLQKGTAVSSQSNKLLQIQEKKQNTEKKSKKTSSSNSRFRNGATSKSKHSTVLTSTMATSPSIVDKCNDLTVQVTDGMIMSVIQSCVRASKQRTKLVTATLSMGHDKNCNVGTNNDNSNNDGQKSKNNNNLVSVPLTLEEQREPLDEAVHILQEMERKHGIPLCAIHINPIARAYMHLGLNEDASDLLRRNLPDRITGPESESLSEQNRLNVYDVQAKDKGSYSLLVQGAVMQSDWVTAIDSLRDMTEAGLYPTSRHLNAWTRISKNPRKPNRPIQTPK